MIASSLKVNVKSNSCNFRNYDYHYSEYLSRGKRLEICILGTERFQKDPILKRRLACLNSTAMGVTRSKKAFFK